MSADEVAVTLPANVAALEAGYTHLTVHSHTHQPDTFRACRVALLTSGALIVMCKHEDVYFAPDEWVRVEGAKA